MREEWVRDLPDRPPPLLDKFEKKDDERRRRRLGHPRHPSPPLSSPPTATAGFHFLFHLRFRRRLPSRCCFLWSVYFFFFCFFSFLLISSLTVNFIICFYLSSCWISGIVKFSLTSSYPIIVYDNAYNETQLQTMWRSSRKWLLLSLPRIWVACWACFEPGVCYCYVLLLGLYFLKP